MSSTKRSTIKLAAKLMKRADERGEHLKECWWRRAWSWSLQCYSGSADRQVYGRNGETNATKNSRQLLISNTSKYSKRQSPIIGNMLIVLVQIRCWEVWKLPVNRNVQIGAFNLKLLDWQPVEARKMRRMKWFVLVTNLDTIGHARLRCSTLFISLMLLGEI